MLRPGTGMLLRIPLAISRTTLRPGIVSRVLITVVKPSRRGLLSSCQSLAVWGFKISKLSTRVLYFEWVTYRL